MSPPGHRRGDVADVPLVVGGQRDRGSTSRAAHGAVRRAESDEEIRRAGVVNRRRVDDVPQIGIA